MINLTKKGDAGTGVVLPLSELCTMAMHLGDNIELYVPHPRTPGYYIYRQQWLHRRLTKRIQVYSSESSVNHDWSIIHYYLRNNMISML